MNLDDLRSELNARAGEIDTLAHGRMAGIRAKAAQRRRRKAGLAVATVGVVVGAVIGVPVLSDLSSGPDPAQQAEPFPASVGGDSRVAYQVSDGDASVTLSFTPEDTDFRLAVRCRWSDSAARSTRLTVNGERLPVRCPSETTEAERDVVQGPIAVGSDSDADSVRGYWRRHGVDPGTPVRITLDATIDRKDPLRQALRAAQERADTAQESRMLADAAITDARTRAERRDAEAMIVEAMRADERSDKKLSEATEDLQKAESSSRLGIAVYEMDG